VIKEAIILAGGFGTRLQKVVQDIPKPMADINGSPFLATLFNYLIKHGIEKVILSVGYKHEMIRSYFSNRYLPAPRLRQAGLPADLSRTEGRGALAQAGGSLKIIYAVEDTPLGTGGGIKKAAGISESNPVFVLNGDSFFGVDLQKLEQYHIAKKCDLTIALKPMQQIERYGSVKINKQNRIIGFKEKSACVDPGLPGTAGRQYLESTNDEIRTSSFVLRTSKDFGYINGGIYVLNKDIFDTINLPSKFSFETDLLEKFYESYQFYGLPFDEYFVDIGIPEDYEKAKKDL